ncbi:hypothetical protein PtA15_7A23 [Puccinia triticina]|uniref:Uncharacterized protein n=2 Tax=Puccinia triticina TaxID=208348 RepID=A0ABY7CQN6_9BASI|nr:uncharacterized protein PtA15_7A23 [Puccinia triticina]WAQ86297.1 hypothetical protein PtA15_7A23 [Puccinia triticina]
MYAPRLSPFRFAWRRSELLMMHIPEGDLFSRRVGRSLLSPAVNTGPPTRPQNALFEDHDQSETLVRQAPSVKLADLISEFALKPSLDAMASYSYADGRLILGHIYLPGKILGFEAPLDARWLSSSSQATIESTAGEANGFRRSDIAGGGHRNWHVVCPPFRVDSHRLAGSFPAVPASTRRIPTLQLRLILPNEVCTGNNRQNAAA